MNDGRNQRTECLLPGAGERAFPTAFGEFASGREFLVDARDVRMSYGDVTALRRVSLQIAAGQILALLGPNGAGKTTLVEILEGYRRRTGGSVTVLGQDPHTGGQQWRARIGVVLQESAIEPELTALECLRLYAGYFPGPLDPHEVLRLTGLTEQADQRCARLSGGQVRRLELGLALIGDPDVLFLDEPTTGFDPSARRSTWDLIAALRDRGKAILLTTHYLEEAEVLADQVAIITGGEIVARGSPAALARGSGQAALVSFWLPPHVAGHLLPGEVSRIATMSADGSVTFRAEDPLSLLASLAAWAEAVGEAPRDLRVTPPSLEDVYLTLTAGAAK